MTRKPFQGVLNIIRFNWPFYVVALLVVLLIVIAGSYFDKAQLFYLVALLITAGTMLSLLVSLYIYDLSGLYNLDWIDVDETAHYIVNIHAGFDETSVLLQQQYPHAQLDIIDFYDPVKHTEPSIKRARKAYPVLPQTVQADTGNLPLQDNLADKLFVIFSAHEIRDISERELFIRELIRVVKPGGQIYITEHLRDVPNFLAYNIGFFHFYSRKSWLESFDKTGLQLSEERKSTPFISTFILTKNDNTL